MVWTASGVEPNAKPYKKKFPASQRPLLLASSVDIILQRSRKKEVIKRPGDARSISHQPRVRHPLPPQKATRYTCIWTTSNSPKITPFLYANSQVNGSLLYKHMQYAQHWEHANYLWHHTPKRARHALPVPHKKKPPRLRFHLNSPLKSLLRLPQKLYPRVEGAGKGYTNNKTKWVMPRLLPPIVSHCHDNALSDLNSTTQVPLSNTRSMKAAHYFRGHS